ncbi:ABC transporter permease [Paenibacillus anaericanus]|uniref:ABC transporter permease n=1 Tax=Paenibacillus anaericanus TaxID=170367 RepID=A0A3S1DU22_9BACL|nr:methionine ABC transporter permease [Paenibacillus anaericanus]RUT45356.1 ABC transporter permease [Paenibacillus anaericanus]
MLDQVINKLLPNVSKLSDVFYESVLQTLQMFAIAGCISFVLGLFFGIVLLVCKPNGILANKWVYYLLDKVINVLRSIPFIIMIALLIPLTRLLVGTAIGTTGAIFPLVVGITPFFSRQIESALSGIDPGLVESGKAMGMSANELIIHVYLKESIPAIVRATTITSVNLIGLSAIVGVVGGGGIGNFAIMYGYQRNQLDATSISVIALLIIVSIIELVGKSVLRKTTYY